MLLRKLLEMSIGMLRALFDMLFRVMCGMSLRLLFGMLLGRCLGGW